ncbi:uncharacterized protein M6B38_295515 [Iris pallida]|uniref:Uncharacterized protein n=1 Tax=Iris pallida TaxID=29817 RepID=A0AAX6HS52_IRIPA|nr:uncharacterized protein M6B38_295515 [Iris pallida]
MTHLLLHRHKSRRPPKTTKMPSSKTLAFLLLLPAVALLYLLLSFPTNPFRTTAAAVGDVSGGGEATGVRHLLFGVASSSRTFPKRKGYLRLWWRPGATKGAVFLDSPLESSADGGREAEGGLPPAVVSADTSRFPYAFKSGSRSAVRVARIVKELVDSLNQSLPHGDVRWIVLGDDDTVFFPENLAGTLAKYDWEQWHYIGGISESVEQNVKNSFNMAFGGGGFAISYPLARVLSRVLDSCLMRYGHLYGSDARVFACLAELGVGMTHEPGFHQIDLRGDLLGMLSAHPLAPVVSLHHLDYVDPLFPGMNRTSALKHLFEAVAIDPGRIFQQTVCYDPLKLRTVSISWGYVIQIYEGKLLLPDLLSLQPTFTSWRRRSGVSPNLFMFDTREFPKDLCKRPATFFLGSVFYSKGKIESTYKRRVSGDCQQSMDSTKDLHQIKVSSEKFEMGQSRRHCCDILASEEMTMEIDIRRCKDDELIAMNP